MFEINRQTGTIGWGDYTFPIDLTLEKFQQLYPELVVPSNISHKSEKYGVVFQLPELSIDNHAWESGIRFFRHIAVIFMHNGEIKDYEFKQDGQSDWWRTTFAWLEIGRKRFIEQLGQPHRISIPSYYMTDEDTFLSESQLKLLVNWDYKFEWGDVWFGYDTQNVSAGVSIRPSYYQQITSWDELLADHRYWMQHKNSIEHYSADNALAIERMLRFIRDHFDFNTVFPRSNVLSMSFNLRHWNTKVWVDVRANRPEKKYYIYRDDTTRKAYATDATLIDTLRVFLETEKL